MVIAVLTGALASASPVLSTPDGPPRRGEFVVDNEDLSVAIRMGSTGLPAAAGALSQRARACPVAIVMEEGVISARTDETCHPLAYGGVSEAVASWQIEPSGSPGGNRMLGELVFVFDHDEGAMDAARTRLYVVPQAGTSFDLADGRVERYPIQADAIEFPVYPRANAPRDTRRTVCMVRIEVDGYGAPADIAVSQCDPIFVAPTARAFERWHFTEMAGDALPFRLVRFRARYARAPDRLKVGEVTLFEPDGIRVDRLPPSIVFADAPDDPVNDASPTYRRAPKLAKKVRESITERTVCRFDVRLDDRGRPVEIVPQTCPDDLRGPSVNAIEKWRWAPAERDGSPIASATKVSLRFDPLPR